MFDKILNAPLSNMNVYTSIIVKKGLSCNSRVNASEKNMLQCSNITDSSCLIKTCQFVLSKKLEDVACKKLFFYQKDAK